MQHPGDAWHAHAAKPSDLPVPGVLYRHRVPEDLAAIPSTHPADHTMADQLHRYVAQRVPARTLTRAVNAGIPIHVHGIYPTHLAAAAAAIGYHNLTPLPARARQSAVNWVRPAVLAARSDTGRQCIIIAVPPGRDYLRHYSSMVRHVIRQAGADETTMLATWRYPLAETSLATWTGLDTDLLPTPPATVVMGKVDWLEPELQRHGWHRERDTTTDYYRVLQYTVPGRGPVTLLGVHYSYWGSAAARVAVRCAELGAREVIYVAKLGTLTGPSDLYARLFVPSSYAAISGTNVAEIGPGPPNGVLAAYPTLDSGLHVSVPTVLEEDYAQRALAASLGANTIDNELAHIALALADYNRHHHQHVSYSAVHYATDYLPARPGAQHPAPFSLATGRTHEAVARRRDAIRLAAHCLITYLQTPIGAP